MGSEDEERARTKLCILLERLLLLGDGGSTVNLCALDLSKTLDKVNHSALNIKPMKRRLSVNGLTYLLVR